MKRKLTDKNFIIILVVVISICSCVTAYATNEYLYDSNDVRYDNSISGIESTNVQGAIDELYTDFSDYSFIKDLTIDNANFHNSIFRGEDVTDYYDDGTLWTRISSGEFTDLYLGDYIYKNNTYWRIAGFDIYLGKGDSTDTSLNQTYNTHHVVIVPDGRLTTAKMNSTNTTEGGYVASNMYTAILPNVLTTYINPVFSGHILSYRNLLTNATDTTRYNRYGTNNGASSNWAWYTRQLDLMNENQVTGSIEWSSSGYETGSDNIQFPLFALRPEYVIARDNSGGRQTYWLRNVATSSNFAYVHNTGHSSFSGASTSFGVRPYFYID